MWKEFLDADTFATGPGLARVAGGRRLAPRLSPHRHRRRRQHRARHELDAATTSRRPTGTPTAGWRGIPSLDARDIADEWIRMTWSARAGRRRRDPRADARLARGVRRLHDAARPASPDRRRPLRADARERRSAAAPTGRRSLITAPAPDGIGFDRTRAAATPSRSTGRRSREQWSDPATTPENAPALVPSPAVGLPAALGPARCGKSWCATTRAAPRRRRDFESALAVASRARSTTSATPRSLAKLRQQAEDAAAWRDKCLRYFQTFSQRPLPAGSK